MIQFLGESTIQSVILCKIFPLKHLRILFFLLTVFASSALQAQRGFATGGSIGLSYTALPERPFKDTSGSFGYQAIGLHVSIPVLGNRNKAVEGLAAGATTHFYEISAHGNIESFQPTIGFIAAQRQFYNASAGLGGLFYACNKNIILANASIGLASDQYVIENHDMALRFSGSFIVNHIQRSNLMFQYGLVFTYAYGRPLLLPALGFRKKFAKTWSLAAILPVSIQLSDRINKNLSWNLFVRPAGNRFQFQNQGNFSTESKTLYMQFRQFELGTSMNYRISMHFGIIAEAGLLAAGKLKFTESFDSKIVLAQQNLQPGFKGKLTLRYLLPHKKAAPGNLDNMEGEMMQ